MAINSHIDAVIKVYYTEEQALAGGTTNMLQMDLATGEVSRTENPGSADNDFNFFIYREYWYRFEFNEPIDEFYVDWDDGENNNPLDKANFQKVKFDVPKFFGIASHIYTKNSKFFPLVKAKSTHGYWSKYYTNDHTDNNYSELENATLTGGQNEYSIVSEVGVVSGSDSNKLFPYFVPHNLPPTGILKTDRKRISANINNDLIDSSVTNGNKIYCYCDNVAKNASGSQITLDIVYQDTSGKIKNAIFSSYDNRTGGTLLTIKKLLSVKLQNLKEVTTSTGTQLKSTERVYVRKKSDDAVIAMVSLGNPYITYDVIGSSALLDASESITKASNVDIKTSGDGGYYWDLGDFSFGSPNVVTQSEAAGGTHCKNPSDELPATTVSTDSQKRVRYTPDLLTTSGKRSYKDSFGRFFTEEKLCRVQVEDNHTDYSDNGFQEDTFAKSYIESFRRDTYTLEKYVPSDYVNEGLILAYYDDAETSSFTNVWTDKSTVLTDSTSSITLGTTSASTIANGPHQHILLVRERKFNKIFIGVKNTNQGIDTDKIRINLRYVAVENGKRVWKPLAFVDNTSIGDDLSLRKNGSLVFDMPEDWVLAQGDTNSASIWENTAWDSAPPRVYPTNGSGSTDPDELWDFDGYGLMIDISVEGPNFDDTGSIVQIIPFDNSHSQLIEVEDPHHVSLSNIAIAQSMSWKRRGKYYNVEDRLGKAEIRKIGVEGAGTLRLGGIELDDSGTSGTASYKLIQNYQEKGVPVFIDVERRGGEFIRFFGKITTMSEDSPTGKMIPKWAVDLAISHIIEFSSTGLWVSDTPVGLGGYIEDEPRYIPTTVQL